MMWPFWVKCHVDIHFDVSIRTDTRKHLLTFGLPLLWVVTKNKFQSLILQWPKFFSCQACSDRKFLVVNLAKINNFWSLHCGWTSMWQPKLFNCIEGKRVIYFWTFFDKGFPKTCDRPPFLVTIKHWGCVEWWLKNFGRHLTHPHHQMVIESFWSPKRAWGAGGGKWFFFQKWYYMRPPFLVTKNFIPPHSDGDRIFSIIEKGGGMCYHFGKNNNYIPRFLSWATKEF